MEQGKILEGSPTQMKYLERFEEFQGLGFRVYIGLHGLHGVYGV